MLLGLSGLSGCRGVSGLSGQPCKRTHILTEDLAVGAVGLSPVGLSGGVGWCRVVSGCRGGVGLVSDDSVGLSSYPSGLYCRVQTAVFWS